MPVTFEHVPARRREAVVEDEKKREEAREPMRLAVSLDRTDSKELLIHYGDILYKLNDRFMASIYWKKALEKGYDPEEIEKRLKLIE